MCFDIQFYISFYHNNKIRNSTKHTLHLIQQKPVEKAMTTFSTGFYIVGTGDRT